tara:strand:+ start:38 stop:697 length:660 start_codon:yes stop_codon:yes gene_type:complete
LELAKKRIFFRTTYAVSDFARDFAPPPATRAPESVERRQQRGKDDGVVVDGLVVSVVADWPVKVVVVFFSIIDWCVPTESAFDKSDVLSKVFFFFFFFFRCSEGLRARRVVVVVVALNFCSGGGDVDDATNAIETSLIWRPTDRVDPSRELFWGDKELREIARRARRVLLRGGFTRDYGWRTLPERAGREHEKIGGDILSRWRISGQSFGVRPIARRRA